MDLDLHFYQEVSKMGIINVHAGFFCTCEKQLIKLSRERLRTYIEKFGRLRENAVIGRQNP